MSLQHVPEFTHCCVNSRFIYLVRRDGTMDHVARFAIHKEADVRTRWRFCIGFPWKHCCLHISLLKFHLLGSEVSVQHVQGTRVNETLTHEGMMTHSHA